jgi:hypothetical protein
MNAGRLDRLKLASLNQTKSLRYDNDDEIRHKLITKMLRGSSQKMNDDDIAAYNAATLRAASCNMGNNK